MKQLLYKEFKLAKHPTTFLFLAFALMLLIPAYPYYVAFMYTCLGIFFIFLTGRENNDVVFTALLPVCKRDIVKARCLVVVMMELAQLLVSIPFAILGTRINPNGCNPVGIEANAALFGLVLVMYGLFNRLFLPTFYKTGYQVGKAFLSGGIAVMLYILVAEVAVQAVPVLKATLDTFDPASRWLRLLVLAVGVILFALCTLRAYRLSAERFERVDL